MKKCKLQFPRFSRLKDFRGGWDLHAHTDYTDGNNTVAEMIGAAEALGLDTFALTEHVRSTAVEWWNDFYKEADKARQGRKQRVMIGIEANAIGPAGNIDVPAEIMEDAELVLGAVHGYYDDQKWEKIDPSRLTPHQALKYEIEKTKGLCENPDVHALAHPGWLYNKYYGILPLEACREIAQCAVETGTAVELNARYLGHRDPLLIALEEKDPLISLGSNAHSVEQIRDVLIKVKEIL